jgi:hypothetical protein
LRVARKGDVIRETAWHTRQLASRFSVPRVYRMLGKLDRIRYHAALQGIQLSAFSTVGRFRNESGIGRIGRRFSLELASLWTCRDRHAESSTESAAETTGAAHSWQNLSPARSSAPHDPHAKPVVVMSSPQCCPAASHEHRSREYRVTAGQPTCAISPPRSGQRLRVTPCLGAWCLGMSLPANGELARTP